MRKLLLVVLIALCAATAASADTLPTELPTALPTALPSAPQQNLADTFSPALLVPPEQPEQLSYDQLLPIWQAAGQAYGVPWSVLAAINKVESNFGQNMGPSSAGAVGWMQFMPDTWSSWGIDANGDGNADPWDATDAIYSAARYLAASGASTDIRSAVFSYNHADWYVDEVLQLAQQFDAGGVTFAASLAVTQQQLDDAKQAVLDAQATLDTAQQDLAALQQKEDDLIGHASLLTVLSDRLDAQKAAGLADADVQNQQAVVDAAQLDLQTAQATLTNARDSATATSFATGTGSMLQAPAYNDGYVFPVAGGAGVVRVGHTHHDYPAADIDAPAGTQEYALHDGVVDSAWPEPSGNCGIGFTISTTDGLTWTYCHLSYLEPTVVTGAELAAGDPVGLVGQTGHADGPHLHLQLQPATGYPQDEAWFQAFAGTAFSWADTVQTDAAPNPVFEVVSDTPATDDRGLESASPSVVYFSTGS
jgi:murein DD-endopeptidase MepM/ murein hydrolase activator NlpD